MLLKSKKLSFDNNHHLPREHKGCHKEHRETSPLSLYNRCETLSDPLLLCALRE
jgi:hypothetical protein